ncbi:MAG: ABC transporter ATP-binding protein [Patescibacteria group bacterium]|nr:ABC transporter ATP-binding protein [Patescibacteria group bacterium]
MNHVIEVKDLGKKYTINHHRGGYITLRDVLTHIIKSPLRFLKKKAKEVAGIDTKEDFWALRHVDFAIEPGEVVGVIGRNGAGKSTLLKILTGITPPTEGEVRMKGRIASLLEVGTGFHPELTGRENIFLNGAILGMTRKEIAKNFDSIVAFAEIEKFLDTPVKYYSSGMYVRLAFSVASHMEPDILLVDEVLAVGDTEFQKKCLGKMEEVTQKQGRTILFVSHNLSAIRRLCKMTILIEKGEVKMFDATEKVIGHYLSLAAHNSVNLFTFMAGKKAQVTKVSIKDKDGELSARLPVDEGFSLDIEFEVSDPTKAVLSVLFYAEGDILLFSSESDKDARLRDYTPGTYRTTVKIPPHLFNVGMYYFEMRLHRPGIELMDIKQNVGFEITDSSDNPRSIVFSGQHSGKLAAVLDYQTEKTS